MTNFAGKPSYDELECQVSTMKKQMATMQTYALAGVAVTLNTNETVREILGFNPCHQIHVASPMTKTDGRARGRPKKQSHAALPAATQVQ